MTVECRECGTSVSGQFARVFGDESGVVHNCPECTTYRQLKSGAGAGLEIEETTIH